MEVDSNNSVTEVLQGKRRKLSRVEQRAEGARVRSRYIKDTDVHPAFFFGLGKRKKQSRTMSWLIRPDGRLTSDPKKMQKITLNCFSSLFTADNCCPDTAAELLMDLFQLSAAERVTFDIRETLQFTEAWREKLLDMPP